MLLTSRPFPHPAPLSLRHAEARALAGHIEALVVASPHDHGPSPHHVDCMLQAVRSWCR